MDIHTGERLLRQAAHARAFAVEIAILTGHLALYPTGILQERPPVPAPQPPPDSPGAPDVPDVPDVPGAPDDAVPAALGDAAVPVPGLGTTPRRPVLLLHGLADNRSVFARLRRTLRRAGWTEVYALNHSPLTRDARTAAAALGAYVERIAQTTGRAELDLVGHSLGGLIGRYYVQRLGGDARVRNLVTLGTPHGGTRAVPLLTSHPLIRQMRPNSELITELAEPAPGCRTRFTAFWSDFDEVIDPLESARIDHPDLTARNVRVPGIGHLTLPVHAAVAAGVRTALSGENEQVGGVGNGDGRAA
jgi:pimeloyl-ACP methyl ester carboxylesterase